MKIDTLEDWRYLKDMIARQEYRLWQWVGQYNGPDGFLACFCCHGKQDVEVVTYSREVQEAILQYL